MPKGGIKGHSVSIETRVKISKALMGQRLSKETKNKMSIAKKGTKAWWVLPGKESPAWKTLVGYRASHEWVRKTLIKQNYCQGCYQKVKTEWANISQQYYKEENDWLEMCRSCHKLFDNHLNKEFELTRERI